MIVQFSGETRKDAIINYFSLDIEEEDEFFEYLENMGYSEDDDDEIIINLVEMYRKNRDNE